MSLISFNLLLFIQGVFINTTSHTHGNITYNFQLSQWLNSMKLPQAKSRLRWLNGEWTIILKTHGSQNIGLLAVQPSDATGSPSKFYWRSVKKYKCDQPYKQWYRRNTDMGIGNFKIHTMFILRWLQAETSIYIHKLLETNYL